MKRDETHGALDALHAAILRAGEDRRRLLRLLDDWGPDETQLVSLLRRALPVAFLEVVGTTRPWCDRPSAVAQVVLHARCPRGLSLRLLPQLFWKQLADVAATPHVPAAVRVKAEGSLKDQLRDLRLGEKVALARIATPPLIQALLAESEPKVLGALLDNPRMREADLLQALRRPDVSPSLIAAVADSPRWAEKYFVRLELVLQPRTPLPIAMLQLSSLVKRDLRPGQGGEGASPAHPGRGGAALGRRRKP